MRSLDTYFDTNRFILLAASLLIYGLSVITFAYRQNKNFSVILLITATFLLGLFAITLDPYLNIWDEQFHALVAKNLTEDFLKPVLYKDPVFPYANDNWTENHIWLHKQPLFLWQMTLSIKLFGPSVFAIRVPDLICFTFAVFCTYRIGKNLVNQPIGYLGALFFSSNYFFVALVSGSRPTDHNDVVFISYITASIWAFSEHILYPAKKRWILLIGIFSGAALLTKWLAGLLVYAGWCIYIIARERRTFLRLSNYKNLAVSLAISLVIFLPWQVYIWSTFPVEAGLEYKHNLLHFNTALGGHSGDDWYYYDTLNTTLGHLFTVFCFCGLILLNRFIENKNIYITFLSMLMIAFAFFTMARTKMEAFPLIVSSLLFISVAGLAYSFLQLFRSPTAYRIIFSLIISIGVFINLDPERIQLHHTYWKNDYASYYDRHKRSEWKNFCDLLNEKYKSGRYAVFNCPDIFENISLMYYTDFTGYKGIPTPEDIHLLRQKGYRITVVDNGDLPDSIVNNKSITIVSAPAYKAIRTDTVYIKSKDAGFLSMFGEDVICNDPSSREVFTIRYFSDGSCYIRNSKGAFASVDYEWKGKIRFKKKAYTITERFRLELVHDNVYKIKTADDNTVLKAVNNGEAICADDRPEWNKDEFEIIGKN